MRAAWILAVLLVAACAVPRAPSGGPSSCETDDDCDDGERCKCRGVGVDPCTPDMTGDACSKARCGGRICVDPKNPPPPPP